MMQFQVVNRALCVGCIRMTAIASASLLQIGDTEQINLYSMFDTPPESIIVGPLAPLAPPPDTEEAEGESDTETTVGGGVINGQVNLNAD